MPVEVTVVRELPADADVVAVPVFEGGRVPDGTSPALDTAFLAATGFEAKVGRWAAMGVAGRSVVAIGMGERDRVTPETFRRATACVVGAAWHARTVATTLLDAVPPGADPAPAAAALAEAAGMAAYSFDGYKNDPDPCRLERLVVVAPAGAGAGDGPTAQALRRGQVVARAVGLARDLVNEPAGVLTPTSFAGRAREVAEREGLRFNVLDEGQIADERLGGLLGVARGADEPPRLVDLLYEPPGGAERTLALVGKGITFDSGGLSLKTAEGMMTMKTDMSGAAAVLGAMSVLPALAPAVRVVGILPLTENMPGGRATKPGDVLHIRNGKTVEVLNTDAEGRLVLADALSLAVERGADAIVDLATLTGAQVVALGRRIAAVLGNDADLVARVRAAAERAGESVWELPLAPEYREHLDSEVADLKNIGEPGQAGTIVAGLFLSEFVSGVPWAHLDIAGPARADCDHDYVKKGGTGFGVRTLVELVTAFSR